MYIYIYINIYIYIHVYTCLLFSNQVENWGKEINNNDSNSIKRKADQKS